MYEELTKFLTSPENHGRLWLYISSNGLTLSVPITKVSKFINGSLWVDMGPYGDRIIISENEIVTKQADFSHPRMVSDACYKLHRADCYIFRKG